MRRLVAQFARFGLVGGVGLVVDFAVFNILRATVLDPHVVDNGQLWANVISTSIAILVNWLGNRYWTFRHSKRHNWAREAGEFAVVSLIGLGISLFCLWFSDSVLGFRGAIPDNIAKNVVGLALGTAFRFTFYRLWVFRGERSEAIEILGVELPEDTIGGGAADEVSARPSAPSHRAPGPATAADGPRPD